MIRDTGVNVFRFVLLVLLQVFVLNNIQFSGFVNPYLYVLFVLLLPVETPGWLTLASSFAIGLVIDVLSATLGYHTIATTFMAYFRVHLLRLIAPHDGYGPSASPAVTTFGLPWFLKYTVILVLAHHLVLFWIESFRFDDLLPAALRALASGVFTVALILVCQFLTIRRR